VGSISRTFIRVKFSSALARCNMALGSSMNCWPWQSRGCTLRVLCACNQNPRSRKGLWGKDTVYYQIITM
jgi:hypothetical protein